MSEDNRPKFASSFANRTSKPLSQPGVYSFRWDPSHLVLTTLVSEPTTSPPKSHYESESDSEGEALMSEPQVLGESGQNDDEDHGHDPSEFLIRSSELGSSVVQDSTQWPDMSMIGGPSVPFVIERSPSNGSKSTPTVGNSTMEDSTALPIAPVMPSFNPGDDPLHFLKTREAMILNEMEERICDHERLLAKGGNKIGKVRRRLHGLVAELSETQQAILEIYNRERSNRMKLLSTFERWEERKQRLLTKINEIHSANTPEGMKYTQLRQQSDENTAEIAALEERLATLKNKQKVINQEMLETESLMESKSTSYVQSLETIESQEEAAILQLSNYVSHGLGRTVPEATTPPENRQPSISSLAFSSLFGLAKPESKEPAHQPAPHRVATDPVSSRIDARLIVESLARQVSALDDLIGSQSTTEDRSRESLIILSDVFENVKQMEKRLKDLAMLVGDSDTSRLAGKALHDTLIILNERLQAAHAIGLNYVELIMRNEINMIAKGEKILAGEPPDEIASPKAKSPSPAFVSRASSPISRKSPLASGLVMEGFKQQSAVSPASLTLPSFGHSVPTVSSTGQTQAGGSFAPKSTLTGLNGLGRYSTVNNALKIGKGGKRD